MLTSTMEEQIEKGEQELPTSNPEGIASSDEPVSPPYSPAPISEPLKPVELKDPNTGEPIRDGKPGVPNSPWVGKHKTSDVDDVLNTQAQLEEEELEEP